MPIFALTHSYVDQPINTPLTPFAALIEKIIEAIKRFLDKPDQRTIQERAIAIFTATPTPGASWSDEMVKRKEAVLALFEKFNSKTKDPDKKISDLAIHNVRTLAHTAYFTYQEMVEDPWYAIDRYRKKD